MSLFTVFIGLVGVIGWLFRLSWLTQFVPGTTPITLNTSICLALLGSSLWLQRDPATPPGRPRLARILALFVACVGASSLFEFLSGWDLHMDQLLVVPTAQEAVGTVRPGLMSPITSGGLLLLGLSMALLDWRTRTGFWPAQTLAITSELGSSFALVDFVLSPRGFHVGIALQTAIVLCTLPAGLIASRPDRGITELLINTLPHWSPEGRFFGGRIRAWTLGYVFAVFMAGIATLLRAWLGSMEVTPPFLTYYPALMIVALLAGVGPAFVCMLLSAACVDYFFLPPLYQFGRDSVSDSIALDIFFLTGTGFCLLLGTLDLYRQRAQADAKKALQYNRGLLEAWLDPLVTINRDGIVTDANQATETMTGLPRARLIGSDFSTYFTEPIKARQGCERAFAEGAIRDCPLSLRHVAGNITDVLYSANVYRDEHDEIAGIIAVARDITERMKAQAALNAEQERFRAMLDALPAMICLITPDYRIAFANHAMRKEFGAPGTRKCHEYLYGGESPCTFCEAFRVLETNAPHDWEVKLATGATVHVYNVPFTDSDGSPLILEMDIDVTEQRRTEAALRLSEAELKDAQRIAHVGSWEMDVSTGQVRWSEELFRMYGLSPRVFAPPFEAHPQLFVPSSWEQLQPAVDRLARTGQPYDLELETVRADGSHGWIHVRGESIRDCDGTIGRIHGVAHDITDRKHAELRRQRAESSVSALVESTEDQIWSVDLDLRIRTFNRGLRDALKRMHGTEVAIGKRPEQVLPPDIAEEWIRMYQRALSQGPFRIEYTSSPVSCLDLSLNPILENGRTVGISVFSKDISERKRAEAALRISEERYRSVVAAMAEGVVLQDSDGKIIACNASGENILGIDASQLLVQTSVDFERMTIHEDGSPFPAHTHPAMIALRTGKSQSKVCMGIRKPNDRITWILINAEPMFHDGESRPYAVVTTFADITERKHAEQKVFEERQKFNNILDVLTPYVVLLTPDYHVAFANREFRRRFGESQGKRRYEFLFDRTEPCKIGETHKVLGSGQGQDWDWTGPDGRSYEIHDFPFTDTDGSRLILEMGIDVTERKQAELALQESETRFRVLVNFVPQLVWMGDPDGLNFYFNQRWVDYTGLSLEESCGGGWITPFHPADRQAAWDAWSHATATGEIYQIESRLRAAVGSYRWFLLRGTPLVDEKGRITRWFGTCTDIDDLKRADTELRRMNEELERRVQLRTADLLSANRELESFNYAVAHDLRAPLRHVRGFSDMLIEEMGPQLSETGRHYLSVIQDGVSRMTQLIDDLLSLSRIGRQEVRKQICGLRSLIDQVIAELEPQSEGRTIEWRIAELPFVECDPSLFKQVLANLLSNALKFTRGRDPAIIEIGQMEPAKETVIFIRDNGVGFDMRYYNKLFGLFQRLHRQEDFEGTGVGLAIVQRVMHRHGGRVWAEAALNHGATFYLAFPPAESDQTQVAAAAQAG